ncbi:phosphoribosyltransferase-like protein [Dipodascopsis tothii]|uniref:phosphoribosyltransferase-like protein n=1 Tax=Dipodascopsis tothii TaxID=44089 RepID=UPI0034D01EBE
MRKSKVFIGSSHPEFGQMVCDRLGVQPAAVTLQKFANGETSVSIGESIRDEDCYIVQSGSSRVNDHIMELLIMISACRGGSANKITAVIPYFPYSKQSKMKRHRGAIAARMLANLLTMAGADHIITMDLHASQMQGFFTKPVDNLYATPTLARWIRHNIEDWRDAVVVSKNPGGTKRVTALADALKINFAMINTDKRRRNAWPVSRAPTAAVTAAGSEEDESGDGSETLSLSAVRIARVVQGHVVDDDYEGPEDTSDEHADDVMRSSVYSLTSNLDHALGGTIDAAVSDDEDDELHAQEKMITLVGDVRDRTAIIIDDMIDRASSFIAAAEHCRKNCGARKVYVIATHGVFADSCLADMESSKCIDHIVVTNTFPITPAQRASSRKLTVIDISPIFAECIRRNHYGESISTLFDHLMTV